MTTTTTPTPHNEVLTSNLNAQIAMDLKDERDQLRDEIRLVWQPKVDALQKEIDDWRFTNQIDDLQRRHDALLQDIEAARKDVERYQWLRHGDNDELVLQRSQSDKTYVYLPRNARLDEMIDAAIAATKDKP